MLPETEFHTEHKEKVPGAGLHSAQGQSDCGYPGPTWTSEARAPACLSGSLIFMDFRARRARSFQLASELGSAMLTFPKLSTSCPIPFFPKIQKGADGISGPVSQFSEKETLNTPNAAYWSWVNSAHHSLLCCQKSPSLPQSRTPAAEGSHHPCFASPPTRRDPLFQPRLSSAPPPLVLFWSSLFFPLLSLPFHSGP